jgi:hypothetical protein
VTVTHFTQTSSATFTIVLLNSGYSGQLARSGTASLAAALAILGATGYKLAAGTAISVVTYPGRTGRFASLKAPAGLRFALHYMPSQLEGVVK